jgi:hypothetical protein
MPPHPDTPASPPGPLKANPIPTNLNGLIEEAKAVSR